MRWATSRAVAVCGIGLGLTGTAFGEAVPPPQRNLVLISLDTVRADHLGAYGYPRPTSPAFDQHAARGVVFEDATAVSPWTRPSHASLLTGVYPIGHGAQKSQDTMSESIPTLPSLLAEAGFRTGAVVNSVQINRGSGVARGFESFRYISEWSKPRRPGGRPRDRDAGPLVTKAAKQWLRDRGQERFFLFVHYYDAHSDYRPGPVHRPAFVAPYDGEINGSTQQLSEVSSGARSLSEADRAHLIDLYDGSLRRLDDQIRDLLLFLDEAELSSSTVVAITSDHGEEFLEHGGVLHSRTFYQEVIRVPLVFTGPGVPRSQRLAHPVSHVDVAPTLLSLMDVPIPPTMTGLDLGAGWSAKPPRTRRTLFAGSDLRNLYQMAVRDRHKLILNLQTRKAELFDLGSDPAETRDLAGSRPEIAKALREAIQAHRSSSSPPPRRRKLSEEELERLRALGYTE